MSRVEWTASGGDGFLNEIAEALAIPHDLILFVRAVETVHQVAYTPGYPDDETIWSALLTRGEDGVLIVLATRPIPGMAEALHERMTEIEDELS